MLPKAHSTRPAATEHGVASANGFTIHWGRTLLALGLLLGVLGALITAALAYFGVLAWAVLTIFATVALISLVTLRAAAVVRRRAKRRARVQRAFDAAMGPHGEDSSDHSRAVVSAAEPDASSAQAQAPFDVREGEPQPQQQPAQHAPLAERFTAAYSSWQPREVPKPKYVVAEKVERAEPEPLAKPQDPVPSADTAEACGGRRRGP
ncbi:hypothetical protein [Nesterenkonia pannonica]|uniref:hypothetical protein n=1 Tax=Nesterenkonia pannonica TaxID=1548602 RepID=UPI002164277F|nr:hypothetical protein [Nesterenkonia pannonica]